MNKYIKPLIEPEWNVNVSSSCTFCVCRKTFNRTRMECKSSMVLCNISDLPPLIEPEWNVNDSNKKAWTISCLTFNRTRMECKFLYSPRIDLSSVSFNRTRMECK